MELTPQVLKTRPRMVLGLLALVLSSLIQLAHPHDRPWEFASGFLLGFAMGLLFVGLRERYRK